MPHPADEWPFKVGHAVKAFRLLAGLSLEEAALRAEIPPEHLRAIEEQGGGAKHRGPTVRVLTRILTVYGKRLDIVDE